LLPPLLSASSFLQLNSTVDTFDGLPEGIVLNTTLVSMPSTGKSLAMAKVRKALNKIESHLGLAGGDSFCTNVGSVEGLMDLLQHIPNLVGLYDEASTLIGTFGRYKASGSGYDKSFYLTLWNAPEIAQRDLTGKRGFILNPRLSICMLSHAFQIISTLMNERVSYDDGFWQRFLASCPTPPMVSAEDITKQIKSKITLVNLFYFMYLLNSEPRRYKFDQSARQLINFEYNRYMLLIQRCNRFDPFLS